MNFDRAFRYHEWGVGRVRTEAGCRHFHVNYHTFQVEEIEHPTHWSSCWEARAA